MFKNNRQSANYIPLLSQEIYPNAQVEYNKTQNQLRFVFEQYLGFISPTESKMMYDLEMSGRGQPIPSPRCGVHALFRDLRIQSGDATAQLEEILDYNILVAQQWGYTENQSIADKRTMWEGRDANPSTGSSLYYTGTNDWKSAPVTTDNLMRPVSIQIQQPLYSGILNSEKVFPVVATKGLRLHCNLENVERSLVYKTGALGVCPFQVPAGTTVKPVELSVASPVVPVKAAATDTADYHLKSTGVDDAISIRPGPFNNLPFSLGDLMFAGDGTEVGEVQLGVLQEVTVDAGTGDCVLKISQDVPIGGGGLAGGLPIGSNVYFKNADRMNGWTPFGDIKPELRPLALEQVNFAMTNVKYLVGTVSPPEMYVSAMMNQMNSSKGLSMDISTYSTYRNTLTAIQGLTNSLIPATQTRAYSVLSVPLDNLAQINMVADSLGGVTDKAQSYQYVLKNKLIPDRPVSLSKTSIGLCDQLAVLELEKALVNCNLSVRNLQRIPERFLIARGFSKYGQVADVADGTLTLRVDYSSAAIIQKMMNHYVCHLTRINITQGNVLVS